MRALVLRFLSCERGAVAIEYVLIAGIVTVGCIASITLIGSKVSSRFTAIGTGLN